MFYFIEIKIRGKYLCLYGLLVFYSFYLFGDVIYKSLIFNLLFHDLNVNVQNTYHFTCINPYENLVKSLSIGLLLTIYCQIISLSLQVLDFLTAASKLNNYYNMTVKYLPFCANLIFMFFFLLVKVFPLLLKLVQEKTSLNKNATFIIDPNPSIFVTIVDNSTTLLYLIVVFSILLYYLDRKKIFRAVILLALTIMPVAMLYIMALIYIFSHKVNTVSNQTCQ